SNVQRLTSNVEWPENAIRPASAPDRLFHSTFNVQGSTFDVFFRAASAVPAPKRRPPENLRFRKFRLVKSKSTHHAGGMIPIFTANQAALWLRSLSVLGATMALGVSTMVQTTVAQGPDGVQAEVITWTAMTTQPPFNTDTPLLLTDGRVLFHAY